MASAVEQLVVDPQSRFLEMKSLQPYSTTDEYLYAMKEDLADWLANMYPDWAAITADNFLECLENGALLCHHANNVNDAARQMSPSTLSLINCKYRADARPQTFNARDNVSQFIKWARRVAGVREVLMFESDDLILRKNEKNFLLCLLEIARFGARFGVSVPAIIKLEDEIEREIARDKQQAEEMRPRAELEHVQQDRLESPNDQIVPNGDTHETNSSHVSSLLNSDGANWPSDRVTNAVQLPDDDGGDDEHDRSSGKQRQISGERSDSPAKSGMMPAMVTTNDVLPSQPPSLPASSGDGNKPIEPPPSSSFLHKTVIQIANSCCCSQRFPVIRIGEGKYRIGENGTIIFIRILRNHVMVRVGGGWDTLENYLNKHDPCRRSGGHRRTDHHQHHHHHHADIPILALPNANIAPSTQKSTPFGKSVTIKTEEFPLPKPTVHDTNLVDAQLVITRGADGRHRIGQITYKSEEDILNQPPACPHHHPHPHRSPPTAKIRSGRQSGRFTPTSMYSKQSSPSTDQDYSSLTETTPSKPSSSSSLDSKDDSIEQSFKPSPRLHASIPRSQTQPLIQADSEHLGKPRSSITESIINNIDGNIYASSRRHVDDFDLHDIDDIMVEGKNVRAEKDPGHMDNDSLESSEGVLEETKKPKAAASTPVRRSSGICATLSSVQKQKAQQDPTVTRKRPVTNRYSSRSGTLPSVVDAVKKEEALTKPRRKPVVVTQRSQSSDILDASKLDRDSGFDEQDFRRERLHSIGDDTSSVCSMRSAKSSTPRLTTLEYKENKSYELRMKKLEASRTATGKTLQIPTSAARRASDTALPNTPIRRYRKNTQVNGNQKQ